MENALYELGAWVAEEGGVVTERGKPDRAGRDLLLRSPPRLLTGPFDGTRSDVGDAVATALGLDDSVLAIQGPPGAGKTYTGARMILAAVRAGKRVGVTATSHKVIDNLLERSPEAAEEAAGDRLAWRHKCDDDPEAGPGRHPALRRQRRGPGGRSRPATVKVVGGTAWLWARPGVRGARSTSSSSTRPARCPWPTRWPSPARPEPGAARRPAAARAAHQGHPPRGRRRLRARSTCWAASRRCRRTGASSCPRPGGSRPAICAFTSELFYERTPHARARACERQVSERHRPLRRRRALGGGRASTTATGTTREEEVDAVDRLVAELDPGTAPAGPTPTARARPLTPERHPGRRALQRPGHPRWPSGSRPGASGSAPWTSSRARRRRS